MNLDDYMEGTYDSNNPANQDQVKIELPTTLEECMQWAKDNDDFEPLIEVIDHQQFLMQKLIEDIALLQLATGDNVYLKNNLQKIKSKLFDILK